MSQRQQSIPISVQRKILDAMKPKPGQIVVLFPVREKRRSLALRKYVERNRSPVVVRQTECDDDLLEQDGPLGAFYSPNEAPALAIGEPHLPQPAGVEHSLEEPFEQGLDLVVRKHDCGQRSALSAPNNNKRHVKSYFFGLGRLPEFWADSSAIGASCVGIVRRRIALLTKPLSVALERACFGGLSNWLPTPCSIGSRGRARTYNPSVNSRLLYH